MLRSTPLLLSVVSLPSRERGLKLKKYETENKEIKVAPLAGAWIEMISVPHNTTFYYVAPLAGAWIEICLEIDFEKQYKSLPSRERGLKFLTLRK